MLNFITIMKRPFDPAFSRFSPLYLFSFHFNIIFITPKEHKYECGTAIHISQNLRVSDTPFSSIVEPSLPMNTIDAECEVCGGRRAANVTSSLHLDKYF
jgi:hypothetical protein